MLTLLANIALYRHDVHFDVTHEHTFTPSPEAQRVVQGLTTEVDLLYFYQKQHPAGRLAKRLVEIMARASPRFARPDGRPRPVSWPGEYVRSACLQCGRAGEQQRFTRSHAGTWHTTRAPVPTETAQHLEHGLRFLHVTAPQRVLSPEEYAETPLAAFGLAPPRSVVIVRTATSTPFMIEFGDINPQGLAQYARIGGRAEIILLPRFVGEPWEAVVP